jgi:DNA invertase Pin-like site-specific DNA recombinase
LSKAIKVGAQSINTSSAIGRIFLTMIAGFAKLERNLISERTTTALQHKKSHGEV